MSRSPSEGTPVHPAPSGSSGSAWSPAPAERSSEDEALLLAVADRVVRMGLGTAAIFFLESVKPMAFLGSQALAFFEPFVRAFLTTERYQRFAALMENRENLEFLIVGVEAREAALDRERRDARQRARETGSADRKNTPPGASVSWWTRIFRRRREND
ncbi:MAG: hypothetical protein R3E12_17580 [Candidatus Eisenbacteria bacterium]|uniref:Uncharacterized protein n=1 Tax=Eiseniibacteriota bacterium TaxID=2212470 RepID=A0A956RP48_UNCEI|nr:hypothetical protein [Candidatus Eisenbacteria bacterium]